MSGYTKLFNSILASTIWRASDTTRLVWITMLAMADKDGICEGSIPGLADLARVSIEDCEQALAELMAPDVYSRTSEHEGRRVEIVDGVGWLLLNHAKYRMKMSEDERREYNRQKQAEWRANKKKELEAAEFVNERQTTSLTVNDSQSLSAMSAHTEAEAHTEADKKKENPTKESGDFSRSRISLPRSLVPINGSSDLEEESTRRHVHIGKIISGVTKEFGLTKLPGAQEWVKHAEMAFDNKFTSAQFLECLALLRKQDWRHSAVQPKHVTDHLPELVKLRKNGKDAERLPTLDEMLKTQNTSTTKPLPPK